MTARPTSSLRTQERSTSPRTPERSTRIEARFARLKEEGRAGLVTFLTAGDPDPKTAWDILEGLPAAGADVIELGMPFSDPMADGPAIQASSLRALGARRTAGALGARRTAGALGARRTAGALGAGQTLKKTLGLVARFRKRDAKTPIVLMGYYNPIYVYGVEAFLKDAKAAGVDGLIVVDLPPEEEHELCLPAIAAGLNFIYLTAPTTDDARLPRVLKHASGFVYYVSITGITGTRSALASDVAKAVARIRRATDLPVAVGFGIKTPAQAAEIAKTADAAVVGSALVRLIAENLDRKGRAKKGLARKVLAYVASLAEGVRGARQRARKAAE